MNAEWIKTSVMWYFRFRRYFLIVVSEIDIPKDKWGSIVGRADVLAISPAMLSCQLPLPNGRGLRAKNSDEAPH